MEDEYSSEVGVVVEVTLFDIYLFIPPTFPLWKKLKNYE